MITIDEGTSDAEGRVRLDIQDDLMVGARIKVVGVGGGGCNAVNRMIAARMQGVEFVAVNTDCQDLRASEAGVKMQIGGKLTKGLGAGSNPEVGRQAALEDTEKLLETLEGADMVFITAGLGGGTGTGATPIVASLASELGALVVAVVTKPFSFEGRRRREQAELGLGELRDCVDTVICIPNEKLLTSVDRQTTLQAAFLIADDILRQAVQGISDLITIPGEINLDFADVRTVMKGMGMALMGTGIATGESRAAEAAQRAISSPLLEDASIQGARGVLINITGGPAMTLFEVAEASNIVQQAAHEDANIIFGTVIDEKMTDAIKVTVIATGFREIKKEEPLARPARPGAHVGTRVESGSRIVTETGGRQGLGTGTRPGGDHAGSRTPGAAAPGARPAGQPESPFLRKGPGRSVPIGTDEGGYGPNFTNLRDDLDIPTFLRRQMD